MTKQERINQYNRTYKGFGITNIKKMTEDEIWARTTSVKSLDDLYKSYSDAKRQSWEWIQDTYKPKRILGLMGSCMTYSVLLVAGNGDILHITRDNNYLVEVV